MTELAYAQPSVSRSDGAVEGRSADQTLTAAMNFVVALLALVFLLPIMLVVALGVYAPDGGPLLFAPPSSPPLLPLR